MKNQFKFGTMALALMAVTFTSCEKEELAEEAAVIETADLAVVREAVTDEGILGKVLDLEIDIAQVTKGDFHFPDGTVEERIYIGDDIVVTEKELAMMEVNESQTRQFRTFNLVTGSNRTVDVIGYTGNDQFGLSNKARTALQWAVNNYNSISNSALRFRLTFGTNFDTQDMVVYDNTVNNPGSNGGVAGFPSNGRPNKFVQIYGLEGYNTNVNEHVITHEIGHSIGFRHSDYYDRQSCGGGGEAAGSVGAIQVPGTPTRDFDSIMQACFSANEDGEFSSNDITAIRSMY